MPPVHPIPPPPPRRGTPRNAGPAPARGPSLSPVFGIHPAEALLLAVPLVLAGARRGRARRAAAALGRRAAAAIGARAPPPAGGADLAALRADLGQALRHVAVVRYDAFGDMGGRLSFSAAVVDDHGDGLVIRLDPRPRRVRTYAKGVVGGTSDATLTPRSSRRSPPRAPARRPRDPLRLPRPRGHLHLDGLDAWQPTAAGERAASARSTRPSPPCAPATSTARWCRSRTPSRAGCPPPSTPSPAVTRSSSSVRCSCRSPSSSRRPARTPLGRARRRHPLPRLGPGARVDGRAPAGCRLRPDAVDGRRRRGLEQGAGTTPPCARRRRPLHGLDVLAEDIGDIQAAVTRFVLVARPGACPSRRAPTRRPSCSSSATTTPGALLALLEQFAAAAST